MRFTIYRKTKTPTAVQKTHNFLKLHNQRFTALFFVLVMVASIVAQTGAVLAVYSQLGDNPRKQTDIEKENLKPQNVRPFTNKVEAKNTPAADVKDSSPGNPFSFLTDGRAEQKPENEDIPFRPEDFDEFLKKRQQTEGPKEILSEKTPTSSTFINPDGTKTVEQYATPQSFKQGDEWKDIDTSLIEDHNPDNSNMLATGINRIKSLFDHTKNYVIKDNDWKVKFSPVTKDSSRPTIQIQKDNQTIGISPLIPSNNVAPSVVYSDGNGRQTVRYENVWNGVNLEYLVSGAQLKENIVVTNKDAVTDFTFDIVGTSLEQTEDGGFKITGDLSDDFTISPLVVSAWKRGHKARMLRVRHMKMANSKLLSTESGCKQLTPKTIPS